MSSYTGLEVKASYACVMIVEDVGTRRRRSDKDPMSIVDKSPR
jgi:hypothetical protein